MQERTIHSHFIRSAGGQLVVTSGVTLMFESMMGHQLEYFKIVRQVEKLPYRLILYEILRKRGILGLWDGFLPWGALQAVSKGAVFGFSHNLLDGGCKRYMKFLPSEMSDTLAGAGAGGVQGLVLSPTLLLKTRVMTDKNYAKAAKTGSALLESLQIGYRLVCTEGISSLMKGAPTFAAKRVGDWGSRHAPLPYSQRIVCSSLGGLASAATTIPLDVIVANIQSASSAGKKVSLIGAFSHSFQNGGFSAVLGFATRGFRARAIHVMLTTVVVKTGTSFVQDLIDPKPSSPR